MTVQSVEYATLWPSRGPLLARPSMRAIATAVAERHGLTLDALQQRNQTPRIAHPRQEAIVDILAVGFSTTQAARFFNLRNHTTAVYARKAVAKRRALAQQGVA